MRDARDGAIVRGGADGGVELGVLLEPGAAGRDLLRLLLENAIHLGQLLGRGAARGQRRERRLDHLPRLEQLGDRFALRQHDERERLDQGFHRHLTDERAFSWTDLDETEAFERTQRLSHRGAADDELLRQISLGWQLVTTLEPPLGDHPFDLSYDLLVDPRRLDRSDAHRLIAWSAATPRVVRHLRYPPGAGREAAAPATSPALRPRGRRRRTPASASDAPRRRATR